MRQFEGVLVSDIDGTFKRGCLEHRLAKVLLRRGLVKQDRYAEALHFERERKSRRIPHQKMNDAFVKANNSDGFEGVSVEDMRSAANEVVRDYGQHVYPFTRELTHACGEARYLRVAISGSSEDVVKPFCAQFGFDIAIGTIYPQRNGYYVAGPGKWLAEFKDNVMWGVLNEYGFTSGENVIAIGDTRADFSMLRAVQYPLAFEPSGDLIDMIVSPKGYNLARPMTIVRDSKDSIMLTQVFVDQDNEPYQRSCTLYDCLPREIASAMDRRLGDLVKFRRSPSLL